MGRPRTFKESLKLLEADLQHANTIAGWFPRERDGVYFQTRLGYSPLAPLFMFLVRWCDCKLAGALGLMHILIYKVGPNGMSTMASHERRATFRNFYGFLYPSLQQLQGGVSDAELVRQKIKCEEQYRKPAMPHEGPMTAAALQFEAEMETECGICLEDHSKVALPGCAHAMCFGCFKDWNGRSRSCPFCRDTLKKVDPKDLWVFLDDSDKIDMAAFTRDNLHRLLRYIDKLPLVVADSVLAIYDSRYK